MASRIVDAVGCGALSSRAGRSTEASANQEIAVAGRNAGLGEHEMADRLTPRYPPPGRKPRYIAGWGQDQDGAGGDDVHRGVGDAREGPLPVTERTALARAGLVIGHPADAEDHRAARADAIGERRGTWGRLRGERRARVIRPNDPAERPCLAKIAALQHPAPAGGGSIHRGAW
jgi:hypothetical protein